MAGWLAGWLCRHFYQLFKLWSTSAVWFWVWFTTKYKHCPDSTFPRCHAPSHSSRHHFSHVVYISICQKTLQIRTCLQPWAELSRELRFVYFLAEQMCWENETLCRLRVPWLIGRQEGSQTVSWCIPAVWQIALTLIGNNGPHPCCLVTFNKQWGEVSREPILWMCLSVYNPKEMHLYVQRTSLTHAQ